MPKRKNKDLDEYINKRLKEFEQKMKYNKRRRLLSSSSSSRSSSGSSSSSRSSSPDSSARRSEIRDCVSPRPGPSNQDDATLPAPRVDYKNPTSGQPIPDPPRTSTSELIANTPASTDQPEDGEIELTANILEILGIDPTKPVSYGKNIQKDLAVRLEHGVTKGLSKLDRKNLLEKHLVPDNCKYVSAPVLNPELKGALSDFMLKRDKTMEAQQKVTSAAISSLGQTITHFLSSKEKNTEILSLLMDTARLLCDRQHTDTSTRRGFIINAVKKDMRDSLENAKIDSFLFGQDLLETLKAAKTVNKTSSELLVKAPPKPMPGNKTSSKNWKGSHAAHKPHATAVPPKPKETPARTRGQRTNSFKPSASQRRAPRSRR